MLDRLIAANGLAERIALLGILIGHFKATRCSAQLLESQQNRHAVHQRFMQCLALACRTNPRSLGTVKDNLGVAARWLQRFNRYNRHPRLLKLDKHQTAPGAVFGQNNSMRGDITIRHRNFLA